jgi:hypothetical protein
MGDISKLKNAPARATAMSNCDQHHQDACITWKTVDTVLDVDALRCVALCSGSQVPLKVRSAVLVRFDLEIFRKAPCI